MPTLAPTFDMLFAAGEVWEMLVGLLFFIMWTVAQLLGGRQEAKAKKKQRRPVELEPIEPPADWRNEGAAPAPQPRNQEEALRSEVEEFLRRAQGKPERAQPQEPHRAQPQLPQPQDARSQPSVMPPPREKPRRQKPRQPAESDPSSPRQSRKKKQASTQTFTTRSKNLGASGAQAKQRMESHLHEAVDHQVGSLEHQEATDAETVSTEIPLVDNQNDIAAEIAEMLRSPQGVRQLIIANEILKRPEW